MRTLSVALILDSGQHYGGHAFNDAMHEAARRNVALEIARCGDAPHLDDVVVAVLSPCGVLATGGKNDVNENSLVALVKVGDDRALFMGDAGLEIERKLLASNVDLRGDIARFTV